MRYLTYADAIQDIVDWSRAHSTGVEPANQRNAVLRAYDEVAQSWEWSFLRDMARIYIYAAQTTGTVEYTHSTRQLEITGGTWPTWATAVNGAALYLDDLLCDVAEWTSSTILTLDATTNPKADVAAEASYTLFQKFAPLPNDFLSFEHPLDKDDYILGTETNHADLAMRHRYDNETGDLRYWATGPRPNGGQALWFYPASDADKRLDVPYRKRPRNLRHTGQVAADYTGTVTVSGGTAVAGSGTAFVSTMAGAVLRVSTDTTRPTGLDGANPFFEEAVIASVTDATNLVLADSLTAAAGVAYVISDPIDLERTVWEALLACARKHVANRYNLKDRRELLGDFKEAMFAARSADAPAQPPRAALSQRRHVRRLADMV